MKTLVQNKFTRLFAVIALFLVMVSSLGAMSVVNASAADVSAATATEESMVVMPMATLSTESLSSLDSIEKFFTENKSTILAIAGAIAIVMIIIAGICFFFGRSGGQMGKSMLLNICLGVAIISAGTFIITLFSGQS